mgnify:CR=1 FL=1
MVGRPPLVYFFPQRYGIGSGGGRGGPPKADTYTNIFAKPLGGRAAGPARMMAVCTAVCMAVCMAISMAVCMPVLPLAISSSGSLGQAGRVPNPDPPGDPGLLI